MAHEGTVQPEFGVRLRRLRIEAGLGVSELARRTKFSKSHLSKVENGLKSPSHLLARVIDAALDAKGALTSLMDPAERGDTGLADAPSTTAEGWVVASPVADSSNLDSSLEYYRVTFDSLRKLGQSLGPSSIMPIMVAQLTALEQVARMAEPEEARVLALASRYAVFVGWMAQEMGDESGALTWTDKAVEMANRAGDHDLIAYANVRRALIAMYHHDAIGTIEAARKAQRMQCSRHIKGLAAQREAQGHALAHDYEQFAKLITKAESLLSAPREESPERPPLGSTNVKNPTAFAKGWALHDLGKSREAAEILLEEFAHTPVEATRMRARIGARLALALATIRDLDRACDVLEKILGALPNIESATIQADLRQLAKVLNRWHQERPVKRIMPALSRAMMPGPRQWVTVPLRPTG